MAIERPSSDCRSPMPSSAPSPAVPQTSPWTEPLRQLICRNQGYLIQYQQLAANHHRQMKDAWRDLAAEPGNASDVRRRTLNLAFTRLCQFLNTYLKRAVEKNFELIVACLARPDMPHKPRLGLLAPLDDEGRELIDLFRDPPVPHRLLGREFPSSSSTAFGEVNRRKSYYHCPDVPAALKRGAYRNSRLVDDAAARCEVNSLSSHDDPNWCRLWREGDAGTCFKSNLVVPVTLANNDFSLLSDDEMKMLVGSNVPQWDELRSCILAYLWMDHVTPDYFSQGHCIDVAYAAADLLSVYLVIRYQYTKYSETFRLAHKMCEGDA
ncbi:MAG: hypothetical protein HQL41_17575 [Alphaproteobacteria bacterium]|nr:hypothetical protein [Alphaproteobacteria bacterium]